MSQTTQVSLCIEVASSQASIERGHSAQWTISAWTMGGDLPDATLQLQATPAGDGSPGFSSGCGKDDGTSSCALGPMDASAPQRQLQAQLTTVAASTATSVRLTVTGNAANLSTDPTASTIVAVTAPPPPKSPPPAKASSAQETITSPLPVGGLPRIPAAGSSLNPGGNAAGLFPTLDPTPSSSSAAKARTRPVANTSALPESASIVNGQLAGLAALALAFVLAVTRLSVRRRSRAKSRRETPAGTTGQEHHGSN